VSDAGAWTFPVSVASADFSSTKTATSTFNNTATTLFTMSVYGRYEVFATILNAPATVYGSVATVIFTGNSARFGSINNASDMVISLSGADIQVTQTSGVTQNVYWTVTKVG
jgi:hypothetical protein